MKAAARFTPEFLFGLAGCHLLAHQPALHARREIVEQNGKGLLVAIVRDGLCEGSETLSFPGIHVVSPAPCGENFVPDFQSLNEVRRIFERSNSCLNLCVLSSAERPAGAIGALASQPISARGKSGSRAEMTQAHTNRSYC
ncbi:hypothetical protein GGE45_002820 [Rhizobium aethiopicum]|nr:hypothetical protein [Rhizobium aethiopicum]